ncbi:pseudaminic acid cytidylyltransferase [Granulosicoccaceae sp. 1_MG-2023]|nr:pseudaminic acid cytidylyltransferase [Granulosicoccaceae sp. 1_MG-2023]
MKVAVIPARGGSKRIPGKNTKDFCGKPMIGWSIEASLNSGCFDRVVVSTDDPQTARMAEQLGAEAPFLRPPALADDFTPLVPVIAHATSELQKTSPAIDLVCCIYATAPFLQADDLRCGLEAMQDETVEYALSVTSYPYPIQRALRIDQGEVSMFNPEHYNTRTQDLTPAYHDAAQFVWGRREAWLAGKAVFASRTRPVILPPGRVQDIDTVEDWQHAEWLFRARQLSRVQRVA